MIASILTIDLRMTYRKRLMIISFLWVIGLATGICTALGLDAGTWMRAMVFRRIPVLLYITFRCVPILLSFVIIKRHIFWLLLTFVFCRSFFYALCAMNIRMAYGCAGWLMSSLALFADYFTCCIIFSYWLFAIYKEGRITQVLLLHLALLILISCIDYYTISPFVESLLNT